MEATASAHLDLCALDIFLEPTNVNTEIPIQKKKITGIRIPTSNDLASFLNSNKVEELSGQPLKVRFFDGTEEIQFFLFDKYFRLIDNIWNHSDFAREADSVTMETRMRDAEPYNVFFNTLKHCPETKEQLYSINFTDLLCPSLGKLKSSLHFTFLADIEWILAQFALRKVHKLPMSIIHGYSATEWPEENTMAQLYPNIDYHYIDLRQNDPRLGLHHSKLSICLYEDNSLRIVIGSANLYESDWEIYNQQLWLSPPCPKLPEGSSVLDGESPTGFKLALLDYLFIYKQYNIPSVQEWIGRVMDADFSTVKVSLIFSMPGIHSPRKNGSILHYLGHLLSRDCTIPAPKKEHDSWRIVAQTASLGLVGKSPEVWLTTHLLKTLGSNKESPYLPTLPSKSKAQFSLIFPSLENVLDGYLGVDGAACCNYEKGVKDAQPWLLKYQCQWKADGTKRSRAMAHSKNYCRISPCSKKMAYFFLSSANLSRSAWGKVPRHDATICVRSYEVGVLFLPKYFEEEYFEVQDTPNRKNKKLFPVMFDLPLTPYGPNDDSFCYEELSEDTDSTDEESNDLENSNLAENIKKLSVNDGNHENYSIPPSATNSQTKAANTSGVTAAENTQIPKPKKKDVQFSDNDKPKDMFFPSFNKKS